MLGFEQNVWVSGKATVGQLAIGIHTSHWGSQSKEKRAERTEKGWILENMWNKFEAFLEGEW